MFRYDGMRTNRRKRIAIATAKQCAQRHLLRRLRAAGHDLSSDLNPAYGLIYAVGVEKQGKQSRLQMIPEEALVVDQRPPDDILSRVGDTSGLHTIPTASNEVEFPKFTTPAPVCAAEARIPLVSIDCMMSSNGPQIQEANASSQKDVVRHDSVTVTQRGGVYGGERCS